MLDVFVPKGVQCTWNCGEEWVNKPLQWCLKVEMVPSKLCWKELDLRNWMASPFTKPLNTPLGVRRAEVKILEGAMVVGLKWI